MLKVTSLAVIYPLLTRQKRMLQETFISNKHSAVRIPLSPIHLTLNITVRKDIPMKTYHAIYIQ